MAPLIFYFRDARESLGITSKQIAEATGKKNMVSHWFGTSQWQLPNEADYRKLQALFARVAEEKHQRGELATPHQLLVSTGQVNGNMPVCLRNTNLCGVIFVSAAVPYTDVGRISRVLSG